MSEALSYPGCEDCLQTGLSFLQKSPRADFDGFNDIPRKKEKEEKNPTLYICESVVPTLCPSEVIYYLVSSFSLEREKTCTRSFC